ncbi:gliding motility lipoprotein GldD [Microscilla marina]|uniref:GldD, putative n=1 Tax=Microscilla marina ATCC 23134 TaxID=313606 RepID=A1ZRR6_MICM2|nr:gliding motility lipoprotein GldD [Microscilla marina]EAY26971.1 GldD, putative [Microscilla marina ATCC 23134]
MTQTTNWNKGTLLAFFVFTSMLGVLAACGSETSEYSPKPKGYNRIDLPKNKYVKLKEKAPYTFELSSYAKVRPDSSRIAEPYWFHVIYPQLKAEIQLTYKKVPNNKTFDEFIEDSHMLLNKHQERAYSIDPYTIKTPKGKTAALFELSGEVPSQFQFYISDSTKHFLRGALYFRTATKNDSLKPVIEFIKKDIIHMLNTCEWVDKARQE